MSRCSVFKECPATLTMISTPTINVKSVIAHKAPLELTTHCQLVAKMTSFQTVALLAEKEVLVLSTTLKRQNYR